MATSTPRPIARATVLPTPAQMVAEAATKAQSLSELLFLCAGEVSDPVHSKVLQDYGHFMEIKFRLLRRIARASQGGHRV